jgi:hypothetical protein
MEDTVGLRSDVVEQLQRMDDNILDLGRKAISIQYDLHVSQAILIIAVSLILTMLEAPLHVTAILFFWGFFRFFYS